MVFCRIWQNKGFILHTIIACSFMEIDESEVEDKVKKDIVLRDHNKICATL
jgi:hypothetical protein